MAGEVMQLNRLRELRARPERELGIGGMIASTADHAERSHKKLGQLIELWMNHVPERLAQHTALSGYRRGVLHVVVDSSSVAYELDRLLRGGLLDQLRAKFRGTLVRVRTRVG